MRIASTFKERPILMLLMLVVAMLPFLGAATPAHAYTVPGGTTHSIPYSPFGTGVGGVHSGDLLTMSVQIINNVAGPYFPTVSLSDNFTDVWKLATGAVTNFGNYPPGQCGVSGCFGSWIYYTTAKFTGTDAISLTTSNVAGGNFELLDVAGISANILQAGGAGFPIVTTDLSSRGVFSINGAKTFAIMSTLNTCEASWTVTPGAGFTYSSGGIYGGELYGTPPNGPGGATTTFPATCTGGAVGNQVPVEAVFGAAFTCSITNMDGGNYVVANNGKFYKFFCQIQSAAIGANAAISDVKVEFNDSNTGTGGFTTFSPTMPNDVILEYNNATSSASLDQGASIATMGTPVVVNAYDSATGVRSMNITFLVALNSNSVNSRLRGIELYASLSNGASLGFQYVQTKYFNILTSGNGGGGTSTLSNSGLCAIPSGADLFSMICQYGATSHNWIAENSTYYQLQQYQSQFSIQLNDQYGNQNPAFWQDYGHSGSGTNPSSNSKDWQIRTGIYYWDNTSSTCCWVKGVNLRLYMNSGSVGSNNLWTQFQAEWYYGSHLVLNQTFFAFVPSDGNGNSQVTIWLNFWYSQNNGSTQQGGEVGAYFTGMHQTGSLIWTSWSPLFQNQTQVQALVPLKDHSGNLMTAQQAQLSMVFMNMSRPGAPSVHTNQANFQVYTTNFQEQEFNVASGGMTGITDPTFAVAVIPTIQSNSIFSPIINALKSIASYIVKGFVAIGDVIWAALGARFPWFTGAITTFGGAMLSAYGFLVIVLVYAIDALKFMYTVVGLVVYPVTIIINTWVYVQNTYLPIFKGANLTAIIEIAVIWIFAGAVTEHADEGDTRWFVEVTTGAWRVVYSVFNITWMIAKLLIDSIEGLIP